MEHVITLHTSQNLDSNLALQELHITKPIHVGGLVNGVNLKQERENTLMVSIKKIGHVTN